MLKRALDIICSFIGLIILTPFLILISIAIVSTSGLPVLFIQKRVGKNNKDFGLFKFRTMKNGADKTLTDTPGHTPLSYAEQQSSPNKDEIINMLL